MYFYFNMGTWLSARFTHAACEKAEKWKKKQDPLSKTFVAHCIFVLCLLGDKACGTLIDLSHLRVFDRKTESWRSVSRPYWAASTHVHVLDHFSRLLFAQLLYNIVSGLLQCQTPRHCRHPSSPLSTKLFRHLACWSFKVFVARLLHCTRPPRAFSKRQGGKKTLKLPTLQILVCAVVTHSLLSVTVCLGLAIFCVL